MKSALFSLLLAGCCWMVSCRQQQDNAHITVDTLETNEAVGSANLLPEGTASSTDSNSLTPAVSSGENLPLKGATTFQAILPCDGCDGIRTRIVLNYDSSSFFMRQVYLGRIDPDTLRLRSGRFERVLGPEKTMILRFEAAREAPPFFMKEMGDSALAFLAKDGSEPEKGRRSVLKRISPKP